MGISKLCIDEILTPEQFIAFYKRQQRATVVAPKKDLELTRITSSAFTHFTAELKPSLAHSLHPSPSPSPS